MLTETYTNEERSRVQGLNDFLVFGSVAIASLSSGSLLTSVGWTWINWASLPIIAFCLLTPLVLTILSLPLIDYQLTMLGVVGLCYGGLIALAALCYLRGLDHLAFRVVALASVLFAGGWLAAV